MKPSASTPGSVAPLLLAIGLGAACGEAEAPWVAINQENAASLASRIWSEHAATNTEDVLDETDEMLSVDLSLVALATNEGAIEVACLVSGIMTLTGEVADPAHPGRTAGDRIRVTASACRDEAGPLGEETDGQRDLTVKDAREHEQTLELTYDDWKVTHETFGSISGSGTMTYVIATQGEVTTLTASAKEVNVSGMGMSATLTDLTTRLVDGGAAADAPFELSYSATEANDALGGTVRFETTVAFTGASNRFPRAGELLIHGAAGSTVRLIAVDASTVRLETDANGDGTADPDLTRVMTWEELEEVE